jgi:hypothetical protein
MYINIAELSWDELKQHVYASDGSLPDTYVLGTTEDDWCRWSDFVNATYRVLFRDTAEGEHNTIDIAAVQAYWKGDHQGNIPFASIFVGRVRVNCFFLSDECIDGDIDPRDIHSVEDHLQLLHYLTSLSHLLGKRVVMLCEGTRIESNHHFYPEPLLLIDQDHVSTHAYWRDAS